MWFIEILSAVFVMSGVEGVRRVIGNIFTLYIVLCLLGVMMSMGGWPSALAYFVIYSIPILILFGVIFIFGVILVGVQSTINGFIIAPIGMLCVFAFEWATGWWFWY